MNVYQEASALDLTLAALAKPPRAVTCPSCHGKVSRTNLCRNCMGECCVLCERWHQGAECVEEQERTLVPGQEN